LNKPMRLGVVGLGAGTLAAYGRPGDYIRFYEINPAIARLSQGAHPVFTYLSDCPSEVDVILGDARVSLEAEAARGDPQNFDVLVLDAFNGDETPTHLLTREAVATYLMHLAPDGVLAFHTTQASLDLKPVIQSLGAHFSLATLALTGRDQETDGTNEWVLLSRNRVPLDAAELSRLQVIADANELMPVWSDDYSSVWPLIAKALNGR
jgi:spermidine synthase